MDRKILTVSVAAYNVENYIRQALNSFVDERVIDELEVFIIDDGGTDKTLEITKEYAKKFPNTFFPVHKENGGYGSTVNYGIAHARGKYFKLLDGDDWFDTSMLIKLIEVLKRTDADIVMTPWKSVSNDIERLHIENNVKKNEILSLSNIGKIKNFSAKSVTVKTKTAVKARVDLPLKCLYTDVIFTMKALAASKEIYYCDFCVYCYRFGREGQSVDMKSRAKHFEEGIKVFKIAADFYEFCKTSYHPNQTILLQDGAFIYCIAAVKSVMSLDSHTALSVLKRLERESKNVSKDIYKAAEEYGKAGFMLKILRRTGYKVFPLIKRIFDMTYKIN